MKTILYNPIFINPQAYYVFPRLTRYLQPDNESTAEPANYIGTIEVKVIAYGDTTLKRTYTNTDSIDLSEFKNTWIRISLFTKVGSCVLGEWKIGNMESDLPYIDPEVLASLKAVVIVGNKTNNDSDRAVVKNLVDPDNPFVISNAAYTEGSGYADKGSPYYGAFVTDGVDDLITSTKTVQEMLGGSNEITVVSMIHQVKDSSNNVSFTNYIRGSANGYFRNIVNNYDKTGIYGYTSSDLLGLSVVNNILGDKNDYTSNGDNRDSIINGNFSVQGYSYNDGNNTGDFSSVAWYWTVIANKVLTTDQINQVIAYFNLDRTLNPDILCNTIKQGITNENHAEFGDKLIDFSGNGRDIQLNNIAWKGDSGIGKYETELSNTSIWTQSKETTSSPFSSSYNGLSGWTLFANTLLTNSADMPSFKIQVKGLLEGQELIYRYYDSNGQSNVYSITKDGDYTLPSDFRTAKPQISNTSGFQVVKNEANIITITQIPSHAGGLCLDGINDFGKVTGLPAYKDYTTIIDYQRFDIGYIEGKTTTGILSKGHAAGQGAFLMNLIGSTGTYMNSYSFGTANANTYTDLDRQIYYQTKYKMQGFDMTAGTGVDGDSMWLALVRDNDSRFFNGVFYSLLMFPYSMSEFLIERQLKKHKLGTLYPDMVEFRPIVKSNVKCGIIEIWQKDKSLYRPAVNDDKTGIYLKKDSTIGIYVKPKDADEVTKIVVNGTEYTNLKINSNGFYYVTLPITKSPQKIDITIDEYIRYEDIDFTNCYPGVPRIYVNDKSVTWGNKLKVGDEFTFYGNVNILPEMYNVLVKALYNGEEMVYGSIGTISKSMVFTSFKTYLLDNNEPKCILSPRLLRIPNSSYKILGHIPDISGHGNHGKINNSAYAGASGANGYLQNFSEWTKASGVSSTDSVISSSNNLVAANGWIAYVTSGTVIPTFKVEISGIPVNGNLRFEGSDQTLVNGVNTIQGITTTKVTGFYISSGYDNDWSNLKIEQIGEYEGAYCFDGVDDFVTIPTTVGGKQVLMKVNWDSPNASILYDQRGYNNEFAIYNGANDNYGNPIPAYQGRNNGQTYIDGILNSNIKTSELRAITHNITITNELSAGVNKTYPIIGSSKSNAYFVNMALYDFMLFDEISTDDKILELNEYVGIEGNTE